MLDLGLLERRLNSDPNLRKAFLADPVMALRKEGLLIQPEKQQALRQAVAKAQSRVAKVPGFGINGRVSLELSAILIGML